MIHRFAILIGCLVVLIGRPVSASIESEVNAVLQDKLLARATLAIQVMKLGAGPADLGELYSREAHLPMTPASNLKLVTTAAALERLGPDFKFTTTLLRRGNDLVLIGDGDPTFGDSAYLKKVGWKPTTVYDGWAAQLKKVGVTTVQDLWIDDSVFDEDFFHPHWPLDQMDAYYEAQVGGMNFGANVADIVFPAGGGKPSVIPACNYLQIEVQPVPGKSLTVNRSAGSNKVVARGEMPAKGVKTYVTVHDPSLFAGAVLVEQLSAAGIKVTGTVKRDRTARQKRPAESAADRWPVIGVHETPLAAVLARANKDSANVYAESLCKRMGFDAAKGVAGSWESGTAATAAFLIASGIPDSDFHLADGCGLSKKNTVSPRALVRVLCQEYYGKHREAWTASLSVAGVDGTLDDRFKGSDLRKRVMGKSGFVEGVSTLSGYLIAKDGQWYVFSIMVNGIPRQSNMEIKLLQERIVKAVDAEVSKK